MFFNILFGYATNKMAVMNYNGFNKYRKQATGEDHIKSPIQSKPLSSIC